MKIFPTDQFPIPRRLLLAAMLGGSMMSAMAQFRVEISGVGLTQLPGDANNDGVVDAADYIIVKTHIGQATGAGSADGDFDNDGTVDWDDLQTLLGAINTGGGVEGAIPEPATLGLLVLGSLAVIRKRRK